MKMKSFKRKELWSIHLPLLFCFSLFLGQLTAQSELKVEIRISSVQKRHNHFYYVDEIKISSFDTSVWFRKIDQRAFKEFKKNVPTFFHDEVTFQSLDSIFEHLQDYPRPTFYKKSALYRIQLIDHSLKNGLILTKTIEIPSAPNGNYDFLSNLIDEYRRLKP